MKKIRMSWLVSNGTGAPAHELALALGLKMGIGDNLGWPGTFWRNFFWGGNPKLVSDFNGGMKKCRVLMAEGSIFQAMSF